MTMQAPTMQTSTARAPAAPHTVAASFKIHSHSTLMYWWVLWLYGAVAAGLTYFQGKPVDMGTGRATLVHPSPWVGVTFVLLLLFVMLFTSVRLRTLQTLIVAMILVPIGFAVDWAYGWHSVMETTAQLVIHMNLAFYAVVSGAIFVLWFLVVFVIDRLSYWRVSAGHIEEKNWLETMDEHMYPTSGAVIRRERDDFIRHKILGLGLLGFGTGNLVFMPTGQAGPRILIENVWRVKQKRDRAQALFQVTTVVAAV